ncbi:MAG: hypothetical protein QG671_1408 [Actinomycetota bacterium]|nr:hypothetical protein [Actinomycetota bacterium]
MVGRNRTLPALVVALCVAAVAVGCSESTPAATESPVPTAPNSSSKQVVRERSNVSLTSTYSDLSTVGPSNQRVVGWNRLEGRSTFLGVPVAVKLLGAVEYTRGSGPFDGYVSFTAADGSQLVMYLDGQATGEQESTDLFGRLEFVGATGRWRGAVAAGEFRGTRANRVGAPIAATFALVVDPRAGL